MKIYFTASVSGKKHYGENYEKIVLCLESLGHRVVAEHILGLDIEELKQETVEEREKHHKMLGRWLNSVDVVVAEVSNPSVSTGYELALALEKGKPVLALHVAEKVPVALLGEPSDKFILSSYKVKELGSLLPGLLAKLVSQIDVRFNFFISPKIGVYLDWIAKRRKLPRAVFLRHLIEEHMRKNKEYKS